MAEACVRALAGVWCVVCGACQRSGTLHELVLSSVDMPQACFIAMLTILADNKALTALNVENCRLFSREVSGGGHVPPLGGLPLPCLPPAPGELSSKPGAVCVTVMAGYRALAYQADAAAEQDAAQAAMRQERVGGSVLRGAAVGRRGSQLTYCCCRTCHGGSIRLVDQGVETICQALQLNHSLDSLYLQR